MPTATLTPAARQPSLLPAPTAHERIGFELGWDYAHHRLAPPSPYDTELSPVRDGLVAGRAAFGSRALQPTPAVRRWLQLRLHAWLRGRSVELFQVTPHYLQQIEVSHCPIMRVALSTATVQGDDASVDRVRNDAGYAAGNLAVMSTQANHAKAALGFSEALQRAERIDAEQLTGIDGLNACQWRRVAVLCSFVEPLSHEDACALPMLVLPPNRLRLFNPVQALQAMVSRQLLQSGWSRRLSCFEELLPGKSLQRDFKQFFMALLPRVLEAGAPSDSQATRWAIEDAWRAPLVQRRWVEFARQLTAAQCELLVGRAAAARLATTRVEPSSPAQATDGWNLDTRGYVVHRAAARDEPAARQPLLC